MTTPALASITAAFAAAAWLGGAPASAQPAEQLPAPTPVQRDPSTALAISAAATGASVAMIVGGFLHASGRDGDSDQDKIDHGLQLAGIGAVSLLVTPSLGHAYGRGKLATLGMGIRLAGATAIVLGGVASAGAALGCGYSSDNGSGSCDSSSQGGDALMAGGVLVLGAGIVYDLATAASKTRERNAVRRFGIVPTVAPTSHGMVAGLGLTGTF